MNNVSALDVINHILRFAHNDPLVEGTLTSWKLHQLLFYCQAWHLVWYEQPLFREKIICFKNSPVVVEVYEQYRHSFFLKPKQIFHRVKVISDQQHTHIVNVFLEYEKRTSQSLIDGIRLEGDWKHIKEGDEVTHQFMYETYSSIDKKKTLG